MTFILSCSVIELSRFHKTNYMHNVPPAHANSAYMPSATPLLCLPTDHYIYCRVCSFVCILCIIILCLCVQCAYSVWRNGVEFFYIKCIMDSNMAVHVVSSYQLQILPIGIGVGVPLAVLLTGKLIMKQHQNYSRGGSVHLLTSACTVLF